MMLKILKIWTFIILVIFLAHFANAMEQTVASAEISTDENIDEDHDSDEEAVHNDHVVNINQTRDIQPEKINIGYDEFANKIKENTYFFNKTLFIKKFMNDEKTVISITRPYGFGKTIILTMLNEFLSKTINHNHQKNPYKKLFKQCLLFKNDAKFFKEHFAKYTVIHLSFGELGSNKNNLKHFFYDLGYLISNIYRQFLPLLKIDLSTHRGRDFEKIASYQGITLEQDKDLLEQSLANLLDYFALEDKIIILMDDYDHIFGFPCNDTVRSIFENFLINGLKHPFCEKALLMGTIPVDIPALTQLSKYRADHVLLGQGCYYENFGLNLEEVMKFTTWAQKIDNKNTPTSSSESLANYCGGYYFKKHHKSGMIYNICAVIELLKNKWLYQNYWMSENAQSDVQTLLDYYRLKNKKLFTQLHKDINQLLHHQYLLVDNNSNCQQDSILTITTTYPFWTMMAHCGYLTINHDKVQKNAIALMIPNKEIENYFKFCFKKVLPNKHDLSINSSHCPLIGGYSRSFFDIAEYINKKNKNESSENTSQCCIF